MLFIIGAGDHVSVNGGYGTWSEWTSCPVTCGEGVQERHRLCDNPVPSDGGADCSVIGKSEETKLCGEEVCPDVSGTAFIFMCYYCYYKICRE